MSVTVPPAETAWIMTRVLGFEAMEQADLAQVLEAAATFAEGVLAPLDRPGDRAGAHLKDGRVVLPEGFAAAFRAYAEGGWMGVSAAAGHGGMGLHEAVALAAFEPMSSANMAFGLCPLLTQDAILLLEQHGTTDQQARLLGPLVAGRWTGTMCLTEPQAGSDLGMLRSRAEPAADGYRLTGQKIFITYGEHEMAENILHMVLARLPDAPPGTAGISLFAVPRILPDGTRNAVRALSLEAKLGIHASPTCVMAFEGAQGELLGEAHRGLPAMFAMMNAARLGVAMQGVAVAERAFRRATDFAAQRVQGGGPILAHPDVRRMLLTMRALALGGRMLALGASLAEGARRALLIPVAKAWCADAGVEAASLGVQVHGGMGFVEETGAAQHLRDARITPIYEGANGIHALTLLRRGLLRDQGRTVSALLAEIASVPALAATAREVDEAGRFLRLAEPRVAEANATPFLEALGTLVAGWHCARLLAHADAPPPAADAARAFLALVLPRARHAAAMLSDPPPALLATSPLL
ncbi:MAG: acyl-CoA dehydrogenase family protein [Rhodospirillales bacterium]|nr:acyl-CoA dehydrogenase family protein [Rhodospirillales bacterium]